MSWYKEVEFIREQARLNNEFFASSIPLIASENVLSPLCREMLITDFHGRYAEGTPGKRYALPHARIMIHQPLGGAQGQATDIQIQAQEIQRLKDTLNHILAEKTGKKIKQIEKDTERDNFMSSQEAVEYGLIDKVLEKSFA